MAKLGQGGYHGDHGFGKFSWVGSGVVDSSVQTGRRRGRVSPSEAVGIVQEGECGSKPGQPQRTGVEGWLRAGREPPDSRLWWEVSCPSPLGFEGNQGPMSRACAPLVPTCQAGLACVAVCASPVRQVTWLPTCPSPCCLGHVAYLFRKVLRVRHLFPASPFLSAFLPPGPVGQETPWSRTASGLQTGWPHLLASCSSALSRSLSPRTHTWGEVGLLSGRLQAGLLPVQTFPDGSTQGHAGSRNSCCPGHSPDDGIRTQEPGTGGVSSHGAEFGQHLLVFPSDSGSNTSAWGDTGRKAVRSSRARRWEAFSSASQGCRGGVGTLHPFSSSPLPFSTFLPPN